MRSLKYTQSVQFVYYRIKLTKLKYVCEIKDMKTYPMLASIEMKPTKTIRFDKETVDLWEELKRLRVYDIPEIARQAVHEALEELKKHHEKSAS